MLRQAGLYFVFRASNGLVALLSLILLTRWLAPDQYGIYALGVSAANAVATLGFQWLAISVGRFYSRHAESPAPLLAAAYRHAVQVSIFVASMGLVIAVCVDSLGTPVFVFATGALGITLGIHNLHMQVLNAQQNVLRYGWLTAFRAWFALLFATVAIWCGGHAGEALLAMAMGSAIAISLFGVKLKPKSTSFRAPVAPEVGQQLFRFGLPLSLTYLSIVTLDAADRFMLNYWHGPAAVGAYGAAFDLIQQTMGAALNVLYLAAYPRIVAAWERDGAHGARLLLRPLRFAVLLVAPLAVLLYAGLASEIAHIVFGDGIASESAAVMFPLALAVAFSGMRAFCFDIALHLRQSIRLQILTAVLMAVINLLLNVLLVPSFGAIGAAWASACAFGIGMLTSLWFGRTDRLFDGIGREMIGALLAGATALWAASAIPTIFVTEFAQSVMKAAAAIITFLTVFKVARTVAGLPR